MGDITMSLTGLKGRCHEGQKCLRKCTRGDAHAAALVAGAKYDMPCHIGPHFPAVQMTDETDVAYD